MTGRASVVALAVLLPLAGCGSPPSDGGQLLVVASTSIVGDLVAGVVGDEAAVDVLIPVGADPHDFAPSARQAASLRETDLVVTSGLGLEVGLADALEAAQDEGVPILELGPALDPRPIGGCGSRSPDPHWWLDPVRAARGVDLIAERLQKIAVGSWVVRGSRIRRRARGPRRRAAGHDAFGYFADRYGFDVIGVVIPGGATQAAPDPKALAALAEIIREEGVPAVFAETTLPTNVAEALAAEVGGEIDVVMLYTGSLGEPGSGADTYVSLLRTNVERIVEVLGLTPCSTG